MNDHVLVVLGTRPEAIKLGPVVQALRAAPRSVETRLCVTGQHREMVEPIFRLFDLVPDHDLHLMTPNQTLAGLTANMIERITAVLEAERPAYVVVQGDTTTALGAAMASFYQRIPVAPVEAGLPPGERNKPTPDAANHPQRS